MVSLHLTGFGEYHPQLTFGRKVNQATVILAAVGEKKKFSKARPKYSISFYGYRFLDPTPVLLNLNILSPGLLRPRNSTLQYVDI